MQPAGVSKSLTRSGHQYLMAEAPERPISDRILVSSPPCLVNVHQGVLAAAVNCTFVADENCTLGTL